MKTYLFWIVLIFLAFAGGMLITKPKTCGADCLNETKTVTFSEFKKEIDTKDTTLIDVRTPEEYLLEHIKGAVNSDFENTKEFNKFLDSLDKNGRYAIYCRSGNRSGKALALMQQKGFTKVTNLDGGILAWKAAGNSLD